MRTKAEALASPEAGDRFEDWREWRAVLKVGTQTKRPTLVYTDGRFTFRQYLTQFRRWAAGAEYLGNEGENEK